MGLFLVRPGGLPPAPKASAGSTIRNYISCIVESSGVAASV
jgi:hypothetical protein